MVTKEPRWATSELFSGQRGVKEREAMEAGDNMCKGPVVEEILAYLRDGRA